EQAVPGLEKYVATLPGVEHALPALTERLDQRSAQQGGAVLGTLAVAYGDDLAVKVHILHSQARGLHHPEAGTVHERRNELMRLIQQPDDLHGLGVSQHRGKSRGPLDPHDLAELAKRL